MSNERDWLERLYLRDLADSFSKNVSRLFPKMSSRLTKAVKSSEISSNPHYTVQDSQQKSSYLQSIFAVFGASVLFVSTPFLCTYVWRQIRSSRYYDFKASEFHGMGIVITGCDSGVGMETAAFLSQLYSDVLIFAGYLTQNGRMRLVQMQQENIIPIRADITNESDIADFAHTVRARLGKRKLYALINNAGIYNGSFFEITSVDIYNEVMRTNFVGTIRVIKAFLPLLARGDPGKNNGGKIINVSSIAAALPSPGSTAYCASKAAFNAFSHGIRQELQEIGIKVILVVPGPLKTTSLRQIPLTATNLLRNGPDEVIQRFGGLRFLNAYSRYFEELYEGADPPSKIAQTIQRILTRRYPKDVYYEDSKIYQILSSFPHSWQDYLMEPKSFRAQIMGRYQTDQ